MRINEMEKQIKIKWSFVQHFVAIGEFNLELQSVIAHSGLNSARFSTVWPWNLTVDLEKQ